MELQKQQGFFRQIGFRVSVDRFHADLIQKLDPGDGDAALDGQDDCIASLFYRRKAAAGRRHGLGDAVKAQCQFGDQPKRPFRTDRQARQVITSRAFRR